MYVEGALMQIRLEGDETRYVTLRAALVLSHAPSRFSLRRLALRYNFPLTFLPPWLNWKPLAISFTNCAPLLWGAR